MDDRKEEPPGTGAGGAGTEKSAKALQTERHPVARATASVAIGLGLVALVIAAAGGAAGLGGQRFASLIACSFLFFVVGTILVLPRILCADGEPSSMRIAVVAVVTAFSVLLIYSGLSKGALPDISPTWAGVLGAAFGGKAVQSLAENQARNGSGKDSAPGAQH